MQERSKFDKPHRLRSFDYSSVASYMLTFNTADKKCILSEILQRSIFEPPEVRLSAYGRITEKYILNIPNAYPNVTLDNYVIMPNHVHILLTINDYIPPKREDKPMISRIIQSTKSLTVKEIGEKIWQLDFYDVIADTEKRYLICDKYIDDNPAVWLEKSGDEPEQNW